MEKDSGTRFMLELIKRDILEDQPPECSTFEYNEEDYREDLDKIKTFLGGQFERFLDDLINKSRRLGMVEVWHELRAARNSKPK